MRNKLNETIAEADEAETDLKSQSGISRAFTLLASHFKQKVSASPMQEPSPSKQRDLGSALGAGLGIESQERSFGSVLKQKITMKE